MNFEDFSAMMDGDGSPLGMLGALIGGSGGKCDGDLTNGDGEFKSIDTIRAEVRADGTETMLKDMFHKMRHALEQLTEKSARVEKLEADNASMTESIEYQSENESSLRRKNQELEWQVSEMLQQITAINIALGKLDDSPKKPELVAAVEAINNALAETDDAASQPRRHEHAEN